MDQIVNNIQLTWKLARMLRTYKICNPTVGFSKYEFNNKLLGSVTLLRVTPLEPKAYVCMYVCMYVCT